MTITMYHRPCTMRSCGLFLLLLPRPPTSTLFPYTTLFRSPNTRTVRNLPIVRLRVPRSSHHALVSRPRSRIPRSSCCSHLDRKSTRLNSSHTVISYAVFCLKKKNHNTFDHYRCIRLNHPRQ